jgi:hypothetical protein
MRSFSVKKAEEKVTRTQDKPAVNEGEWWERWEELEGGVARTR